MAPARLSAASALVVDAAQIVSGTKNAKQLRLIDKRVDYFLAFRQFEQLAGLNSASTIQLAELPEVEKRAQDLRAIIEQSGANISALEKAIGALKGEIPEKTSELSQLKQDIERSRTQQTLLAERRGVLNSEVK